MRTSSPRRPIGKAQRSEGQGDGSGEQLTLKQPGLDHGWCTTGIRARHLLIISTLSI